MASRRITVSELLTHQDCPTKWKSLYVERRAGRKLSRALRLGTAFHELLAEALRAWQLGVLEKDPTVWEEQLARRMVEGLTEDEIAALGPGVVREARTLGFYAWTFFQGPLPFREVLAVEEAMEVPLSDKLTLVGTVDAVVRDEEKRIWHLQWKSLRATTNPVHYVRRIKRSLHEAAYGVLIRQAFPGEEYMGTRLQVFRKLPRTTRASGKLVERNPHEAIVGSDLCVNPAQEARAFRDIYGIIGRMAGESSPGAWTEQRERSCFGAFGNAPCAFLDVCDGYTTLADPHLFEDWDPWKRYNVVEEDLVNG